MSSLGICVVYRSARPVVTAVLLSGDRQHPVVEQVFDLKTGAEAVPDQLADLTRALRSKLSALAVNQYVIKVADFTPTANNRSAPRTRLMIEGALVFACTEQGADDVQILTGKEIGGELDTTKAESIELGKILDQKRADAAAAALAGLPG